MNYSKQEHLEDKYNRNNGEPVKQQPIKIRTNWISREKREEILHQQHLEELARIERDELLQAFNN